jgi:hypothetical protein
VQRWCGRAAGLLCAAALAVGVIAALLLAHVGVGLRNTQQRYPRDYSPSPDTPE